MSELSAELVFLCRSLKAPSIARALPRLAERARSEEWTYERFAEAVLAAEVSSRETHGGEGRIRAARFPARKTLEEFDFAFAASVKKTIVLHLGQLDFLAGRENVLLLGPPGTGKTHLRSRSRCAPAWPATACSSQPPPNGSHASKKQRSTAASKTRSAASTATRCWSSTRSATSPSTPTRQT